MILKRNKNNENSLTSLSHGKLGENIFKFLFNFIRILFECIMICTYNKEQTTLRMQLLQFESAILPALSTLIGLFVMSLSPFF